MKKIAVLFLMLVMGSLALAKTPLPEKKSTVYYLYVWSNGPHQAPDRPVAYASHQACLNAVSKLGFYGSNTKFKCIPRGTD